MAEVEQLRPGAFERDGSLPDIVVSPMTLLDWKRFLMFARTSYRTEYLVDLEPREPEDDPAVIFETRQRVPVLLKVFVDHLQLNCHFFSPDGIELDLDPREVETHKDERRILAFLRELGDALGKTVLLVAEGSPDIVHYRYEPSPAPGGTVE